ncbi:MAG TPA: Fur family transcriptional regulator [Acidimicrobiia bacterium]|jgi:Fur family ferric uptake transcriptional regulator|nr:Fur family transcriptional regulator [Acidimicrobiia bacterium]
MPVTSLDRQIEKRLLDHDVRYTAGRRTVVAALDAADGPMSAAELHATIDGQLPLSSIYRTLTVLEEVGVLAPHHGTKGLTRYELAEWLGGHHHHLICIECGSVEDIVVTDAHERQVDRVVGEISAAASFAALNHALEIEGRCARCR